MHHDVMRMLAKIIKFYFRSTILGGPRAGAGAGPGRAFSDWTGTVQIQYDFETQYVQSTLAFECIIQFIQKIVTRSSLA